MKNPNGYGSVVKLSGNRRRPFTARKTTGWKDNGQPIYLVIGYYASREEGMIALAEYNRNPYDIEKQKVTLEELYQKWSETILPKLGNSLQSSLKSAYKHMTKLKELKYREIRSFQMQETIDGCGCGYSTQAAIKNLWGYLDRFAMEMDVIQKMYSTLTTSAPVAESSRTPFTEDEIKTLWNHADEPWVDTILIMLYSGWRIIEFLTLETANVDMDNQTMKGGVKTRNGKDRIVPIHSAIMKFVEAHFNPDSKYLITDQGEPMTENQYRIIFKETLSKYGINHTPHETRHTFRTRLDSAGANKKCIDMMMGHKSKDVGERVYTHKTLDELKTAIELISR